MRLFAIAAALSWTVAAAEPTAFELVKEGNRHVGEEVQDKVVEIRSEKSVASVVPNEWTIVYYDRDATFKATEVKFAGGKKVEVKRPGRLLELAAGNLPLDRAKLKVDSDRAIAIATAEPLLANLKVTNTRLKLERWEDTVVWKIRIWTERVRNAKKTADLGEVFVDAESGKVVKNDLHPQRAD